MIPKSQPGRFCPGVPAPSKAEEGSLSWGRGRVVPARPSHHREGGAWGGQASSQQPRSSPYFGLSGTLLGKAAARSGKASGSAGSAVSSHALGGWREEIPAARALRERTGHSGHAQQGTGSVTDWPQTRRAGVPRAMTCTAPSQPAA